MRYMSDKGRSSHWWFRRISSQLLIGVYAIFHSGNSNKSNSMQLCYLGHTKLMSDLWHCAWWTKISWVPWLLVELIVEIWKPYKICHNTKISGKTCQKVWLPIVAHLSLFPCMLKSWQQKIFGSLVFGILQMSACYFLSSLRAPGGI